MPDGYTTGGQIDAAWWVREVSRGKAQRKLYAREDRWDDWRRWYRGEWRKGILPSNVYFKMLRTLIPRVYYRNPSVSITPKQPGLEYLLYAKILERADNSLLDRMGIKEQMKRAVQWATMFGTSGIRLGYGAEFTPTPEEFGNIDPDAGGRRLMKRVEYNDLVHPNAPWALAAHPGDFVVPANTRDIHSARWFCYEVIRPKDDVVSDPRFENTKELLNEGMRSGAGGSRGKMLVAGSDVDRQREGVLLWEIRDKKTGLVFVMAPFSNAAPQHRKVLLRSDDGLQVGRRFNFYPLVFNTDDEVFWGVPDSQIVEPQQVEKNEIRTQAMYHRRAALTKFIYEQGSISPDELSKLISDDNAHVGVAVKNIAGFKDIQALPIPPALLEMEALVDQEVQEIMGLGVNQFGEYAPGSADRSATEASVVNMAAQIRVDERRDACADLLVNLVSDMNHIITERWDAEMITEIVGPQGVPIWLKFNPAQELRGSHLDYEVKVDPDTSLPLTKQLREQKAMGVYQAGRQDEYIDQWNLRKFVLNEMYGVDADWLLKPREQVDQEHRQQMMMAMTVPQAAQHMRGGRRGNVTPMAGGGR